MPDELDIVFIDSSVLFAGAMSPRGFAHDLLMAGLRGSLMLMVSPLVLEETERNLARKAPRALPAFALLKSVLVRRLVSPPEVLVDDVKQFVDPKDAPIVAAAIHRRADFLASYDQRDLLSVSDLVFERYGVRIARPDAILSRER